MRHPLLLAAGSMLDVAPEVFIDVAAAAGFDGIGLRASAEHHPTGAPGVEGIRDRSRHRGLRIADVEVFRLGTSTDVELDALIAAAGALGAGALLVVSDLASEDATGAGLTDVAGRCRPAGIVAALEYMAWTTPSDPLTAIDVALATGCRLVVDLLHHHRVGAGIDELRAIVESGTLGWVQLSDGPFAAPDDLLHEARHGRLLPGAGELPLAELLAVVPADTPISVEVQSDELAHLAPAQRAVLLHDAARRVLAG